MNDKTKEYQIKDLSKLLGISKEMIRYYEKYGVVTPKRSQSNNYRIYSVMDYLALTEAISLTQFHANIKDIYALKNQNYSTQAKELYAKYIEDTKSNIAHEKRMLQRAEELLDRMVLGEFNRDKIFVKKESGYWLHPLMHSQNDKYGDILLSGKAGGWFQEPEHLALTDGFIVFKEQEEEWFIGCSDRYLGDINEKDRQELARIDECYCLCTVTDMGEIGTFQAKEVHSLIGRLKEEPYRFSGECRGKLLGRGAGKHGFSRLLELQIPIELHV